MAIKNFSPTTVKISVTLLAVAIAWAVSWVLTFKFGVRFGDPSGIVTRELSESEHFMMLLFAVAIALGIFAVPAFMLADELEMRRSTEFADLRGEHK